MNEASGLGEMKARFGDNLKTREVAEVLGVTQQVVVSWCKKGTLPAFMVGNKWRVPRAAVENIIRAAERAAEEAGKREGTY